MGTWGAGNFDSDVAMDYMDEVVEQFSKKIEDCLNDEDCCALDEMGEADVVLSVVILSTLHEHCHAPTPELKQIRKWKRRYLAVFDETIDDLEPAKGYKEERRATIEATFNKLETQAQAREQKMGSRED